MTAPDRHPAAGHPAVVAGQHAYMDLLRTGDGCPDSYEVAAAVAPAVLRWVADELDLLASMSAEELPVRPSADAWLRHRADEIEAGNERNRTENGPDSAAGATTGDAGTSGHPQPATDDLSPPALALGRLMSHISEEVHHAGWLNGTEWILWRALLDWRATARAYWSPKSRYPADITEYMPELDWLQQQAAGWVWWLDDMTYVPRERWLRLVDQVNSSRRGWWDWDNAELDRLVPLHPATDGDTDA